MFVTQEIGKALIMMKEIAVDLERAKEFQKVNWKDPEFCCASYLLYWAAEEEEPPLSWSAIVLKYGSFKYEKYSMKNLEVWIVYF